MGINTKLVLLLNDIIIITCPVAGLVYWRGWHASERVSSHSLGKKLTGTSEGTLELEECPYTTSEGQTIDPHSQDMVTG